MNDELPADPQVSLRPGACITLITGERFMVLEEYDEVMEKLGDENESVEFQTFRDFGEPGKPDNEPFRLGTTPRYVVSVTEVTQHLYTRHIQTLREEMAKGPPQPPQIGFFDIGPPPR